MVVIRTRQRSNFEYASTTWLRVLDEVRKQLEALDSLLDKDEFSKCREAQEFRTGPARRNLIRALSAANLSHARAASGAFAGLGLVLALTLYVLGCYRLGYEFAGGQAGFLWSALAGSVIVAFWHFVSLELHLGLGYQIRCLLLTPALVWVGGLVVAIAPVGADPIDAMSQASESQLFIVTTIGAIAFAAGGVLGGSIAYAAERLILPNRRVSPSDWAVEGAYLALLQVSNDYYWYRPGYRRVAAKNIGVCLRNTEAMLRGDRQRSLVDQVTAARKVKQTFLAAIDRILAPKQGERVDIEIQVLRILLVLTEKNYGELAKGEISVASTPRLRTIVFRNLRRLLAGGLPLVAMIVLHALELLPSIVAGPAFTAAAIFFTIAVVRVVDSESLGGEMDRFRDFAEAMRNR